MSSFSGKCSLLRLLVEAGARLALAAVLGAARGALAGRERAREAEVLRECIGAAAGRVWPAVLGRTERSGDALALRAAAARDVAVPLLWSRLYMDSRAAGVGTTGDGLAVALGCTFLVADATRGAGGDGLTALADTVDGVAAAFLAGFLATLTDDTLDSAIATNDAAPPVSI